ncbi:MAG: hypothetical protein KC543_13050 [Myxococcales bacterium]|nr:hypothetical protein [Myxococcales bacterium]
MIPNHHRAALLVGSLAVAALALGCNRTAELAGTQAKVERLPELKPDLPEVPKLPPAPYPVTYADHSYSVYGLRHRAHDAFDTDVSVTGYVVDIYQAPRCDRRSKDATCERPAPPHLWLADSPDPTKSTEPADRLMVVGYAESAADLARARRAARGERHADANAPSAPSDFAVGAKVRVDGRFTRMAAGFNDSRGLLAYHDYALLER